MYLKARDLQNAIKNALLGAIKSNIVLIATAGRLNVIGNSGAITVKTTIKCDSAEEWSIAVDGTKIVNVLSQMESKVELKKMPAGIQLSNDKLSVDFYKQDNCIMVKDHEYDVSFVISDFVKNLKETSHALGKEETSYSVINYQYIEVNETGYRIIALDGKRISIRKKEESYEHKCEFLLPSTAEKLVESIFKEESIKIELSNCRIKFSTESITVETSILNKEYVQVDNILKNFSPLTTFICDKSEMMKLVNIALVSSSIITLDFRSDGINITSPGIPQMGEYKALLDGKMVTFEENCKASYNAGFVKEALQAMSSDQISISFQDKYSPLRIESGSTRDDCEEWIMPVAVR